MFHFQRLRLIIPFSSLRSSGVCPWIGNPCCLAHHNPVGVCVHSQHSDTLYYTHNFAPVSAPAPVGRIEREALAGQGFGVERPDYKLAGLGLAFEVLPANFANQRW